MKYNESTIAADQCGGASIFPDVYITAIMNPDSMDFIIAKKNNKSLPILENSY